MHVRQRSTENLLYHLILFYVKFEESNLISGTLQYIEDCLIGNFNLKKTRQTISRGTNFLHSITMWFLFCRERESKIQYNIVLKKLGHIYYINLHIILMISFIHGTG